MTATSVKASKMWIFYAKYHCFKKYMLSNISYISISSFFGRHIGSHSNLWWDVKSGEHTKQLDFNQNKDNLNFLNTFVQSFNVWSSLGDFIFCDLIFFIINLIA